MSLKLGNTSVGSLYLGSTKISEAYLGSVKVLSSGSIIPNVVYLDFGKNGQSIPAANTCLNGTWSDIGNYYRLTVTTYYAQGADPTRRGLARLFSDSSENFLFDSSKGAYPLMAISGDLGSIATMDRCFNGATAIYDGISQSGIYSALHSWITGNDFNVVNVNQAFSNLGTNLDHSYDIFQDLQYKPSIQTHAGTFSNSGISSDRELIPVGWGGDSAPASTAMTGAYRKVDGNYTIWTLNGIDEPTWSQVSSLYVFTTSSVSRFAGVSMNRSRINNNINSVQPSSGNPLYFRPAFIQFTSGYSGTFSWLLTTTGVNGSLSSSDGNIDMPGTLDYSVYGPMNKTYGTYDSTKSVNFGFLVTNADPSSWTGLNDAYALLFNSSFNKTVTFNWFVE